MVPLRALRPHWLADPGREGWVGIELDCPRHPDEHRVKLYFDNPSDGGPRSELMTDGEVCFVVSDSGDELTLVPFGGAAYRPIRIGHWYGWLVEGQLTECLVTGVSW